MSVLEYRFSWPSIARDTAMLSIPDSGIDMDKVLTAYNMTEDDYSDLLSVPDFQVMVQHEVKLLSMKGNKAGYLYRAEALIDELSKKLYSMVKSNTMDAKDILKFMELLMKSAGMLEVKQEGPATNIAVGINFSLPTLNNPKLDHLKVIDVAP